MDLVNTPHHFTALESLFVGTSSILDGFDSLIWKFKPYLLPVTLMALGLQLFLYVE